MERLNTPVWLDEIIGMEYDGITITDAYIATNIKRPMDLILL